MSKKILISPTDPMNTHFTCGQFGIPGNMFYKTNIGAHGEYSLYRNEVEALMINIGTAIGLDVCAAVAALEAKEAKPLNDAPEACTWPENEGWYWAYGRVAGKDKVEVMSAFAVLEGPKMVVYVGRGMTHRLSIPDEENPIQFIRADIPNFPSA